MPECLSSKARCVIRALLRRHPEERITSEDLLHHPWFTKENFRESVRSCTDQMVPKGVPKRQNSLGEGRLDEDGDDAMLHEMDQDQQHQEEDDVRGNYVQELLMMEDREREREQQEQRLGQGVPSMSARPRGPTRASLETLLLGMGRTLGR